MPSWRIIDKLSAVTELQWQTLETHNNPFLSYPFLNNLERFDCLKNQYWQPAHIVIEQDDVLQGAMPLYVKQDSYGEFVFDWAWADAYQRAGRNYYPKLVSAIPFSPVAGTRMLVNTEVDKNQVAKTLLSACEQILEANQFSSLHILFPDKTELPIYEKFNGLQRITCQYHWFNRDYRDFQDFLDSLSSKKRKKIARERRSISEAGIEIECLQGKQITEQHWHQFYQFYCSTFYKKWGEPRLTLDFFIALGEALPEQTLLFLARQHDDFIAGAFVMKDDTTLYGRHWGCHGHVPNLHFELCYYQTIEFVIEQGMQKLDAGVQGEHKLARGFHPMAMSSAHWIRETGFRDAIKDYLDRETSMMKEHIAEQETHLPYKACVN